jgi:ADP-ribosyl-[dinitrogen reductase] hydrolase
MKEVKYKLYGAILGDLAGEPFEFPVMKGAYHDATIHNPESNFSDDTLMTLATAKALLNNTTFEFEYKEMGKRYQGDYYGSNFKDWINTPLGTINYSYGNGCLMRLSPIMYLPDSESKRHMVVQSCLCSHNNPISIVSCLDLYELYGLMNKKFNNDPTWITDKPSPFKKFNIEADITYKFIEQMYFSCEGTQNAIIRTIKCKGDTDTNASIIGELMNYTYNDITEDDVAYVRCKLDSYLLSILDEFNEKFS